MTSSFNVANITQYSHSILTRVHSHLRFLGVNYYVNYLLNDGLYCTKRVHLHLLFGQFLC